MGMLEVCEICGPTYEPVELGGTQRNPEDDVIDEIDELVDWQLENGGQW